MTEQQLAAMKQALEALEYVYEGANNQGPHTGISWRCVSNKTEPAITSLRQAIEEESSSTQEPVAYMRMPKVGDRVVCIEDEDLGTIQSLTAGGSPDIKFDDGSHGTYLLREFAELFRYADTYPYVATPRQPKAELLIEIDGEVMTIPQAAMLELYKFQEATGCDTADELAQPKAEQEPVAWWNDTGTHIDLNVSGRGKPLYAHPQLKAEQALVQPAEQEPKREWQAQMDPLQRFAPQQGEQA